MKRIAIAFAGFLIGISSGSAGAWSHASSFGGHSSGSYGSGGEHSNAFGGLTSGGYGQGATHENVNSGAYGTTAVYGSTAYHAPYYGAAVYPAYHPPTTVNYYSSSCGNCGGWSAAGAAAAGIVVGAAVASASTAAATTNAYNQGVANTEAANGNAYAMGGIYPTLPAGCVTPTVNGVAYYLCGNTWFLPSYGANGVYYRVVSAP